MNCNEAEMTTFDDVLSMLYTNDDTKDIKMICRDGHVKIHQLLLVHLSSYLKDLLKTSNQSFVIFLPDFTVNQVESIIELIYLGKCNTTKVDLLKIREILKRFKIDSILESISQNDSIEVVRCDGRIEYVSQTITGPISKEVEVDQVERDGSEENDLSTIACDEFCAMKDNNIIDVHVDVNENEKNTSCDVKKNKRNPRKSLAQRKVKNRVKKRKAKQKEQSDEESDDREDNQMVVLLSKRRNELNKRIGYSDESASNFSNELAEYI